MNRMPDSEFNAPRLKGHTAVFTIRDLTLPDVTKDVIVYAHKSTIYILVNREAHQCFTIETLPHCVCIATRE